MKKAKSGNGNLGTETQEHFDTKFPIVGVGASAGGLEAFLEFLSQLPGDTGMGYVLISHLAPDHESMLAQILGRNSYLPVLEVTDEPEVLPNHVYVIPPDRSMTIENGHLILLPRSKEKRTHHPIDFFFTALAADRGHKAIGVVLSGTGNDGTVGLSDIKSEGGITFAQDYTAKFDGMPRSAIAAGTVDFILSPTEITREIMEIARHPYLSAEQRAVQVQEASEPSLNKVMQILHHSMGVDFTHYKKNTLYRRINRRMVLHKLESIADYVKLLRGNQPEIESLFQDILINVTSFFRNPEAFDALKQQIFPKLMGDRTPHDPIRIWTLGCSTGEEAYSLAIAFSEYLEDAGLHNNIQIFATDLNGAGVEKARSGIYSKASLEDVEPGRVRRFFTEEDGGYRVTKAIRDMCIFARHNVLAEPPFSRMDLITCRNMLIYLEPVMQQKVLPTLHYALHPDGFLWLGGSETIGGYRDLFEVLDPKHKIYSKKPTAGRISLNLPLSSRRMDTPSYGPHTPSREQHAQTGPDAAKDADRFLLQRYSPPGVVVNSDLEIIHFRGETGQYLAPAAGRASFNLLKMLREGLLIPVRAAIIKARRDKKAVREEGLRVKSNGGYKKVNLEVIPFIEKDRESTFLVVFEPQDAPKPQYNEGQQARSAEETKLTLDEETSEVERLRQELEATREYLQSVIEQQEAANEELQSANEEVQSTNEELQSINEELETSKEEIQSSNEELATVNEELHHRNIELGQSNNDLLNLLTSVQMPIVMLGPDLRIRRFTPTAERILNLIATDVGRKISDLKVNLSGLELDDLIADVIDSVTPKEMEVQDRQGRWYSLRIRPYKTLENKIDGAVLVLVDIDNVKKADQAVLESEGRFNLLADAAPVLIWVHGLKGLEFANQAYLEFVGGGLKDVKGSNWFRYIHPDDQERFVTEFKKAVDTGQTFEGYMQFKRADGKYRWTKTIGAPRYTSGGSFLGYVGSTVDVQDLRDARAELDARN